jgi:hypothetical protein
MDEELFGKLHEEEQYGLYGIEHHKQCFPFKDVTAKINKQTTDLPMDNYSHIRLELGIDAQKFVQQVQINNQRIEKQIAKGIELAIKDITEGDNFVQTIRHNTKKEIEIIVNKAVMSWEVKSKITELIKEKVEAKVKAYADKIAENITSSLK